MSEYVPVDDLGPFQPLRSQESLLETYIAPIEDDPATAVEKLRQLHLGTPMNLKERNVELYAWADRVGAVLSRPEYVRSEVYRKLIRADVANVILDILMRNDFWDSHWVRSLIDQVRLALRIDDIYGPR